MKIENLPEGAGWKLFNLTGGLIAQGHSDIIDLATQPNGMYVLLVDNVAIKVVRQEE